MAPFNKSFLLGFSIGVGAGLVARQLFPAVAKMVRPASKTVLVNGMMLIEKLRETVARVLEAAEDLGAEVNVELEKERSKSALHKGGSTEASAKRSLT